MTRPGLEPGPLDQESGALTTRPPRLSTLAKCDCILPFPAIGEGQFGKVYACVNLDTGEMMAVKQVRQIQC